MTKEMAGCQHPDCPLPTCPDCGQEPEWTSGTTPTCGPEDYKQREDCQTHPWCLVHRRGAAECQPPEVATPETQTSGETPTCGKE